MTLPTTQGIRVFVYGSLKRGLHNAGVLADCDFIGRCIIEGRYSLIDLRAFPGLVENPALEPNQKIVGEVYRVSKETLDVLDMIEGHPDFYCRHKVQTPWKGAWAYFLPHEYKERYPLVPPVSDTTVIWRPSDEEVEWLTSPTAAA